MSVAAHLNHKFSRLFRSQVYFSCSRVALSITLLILTIAASSSSAESLEAIWNSAPSVDSALAVYDLRAGRELFARNADTPLKPASTLKLITAAAALSRLGAEFKFETKFFITSDFKTLIIRGGGDPLLTTEDLYKIVEELKIRGVTKIEKLYLDTSGYDETRMRSGGRAYESAPSPLSFNFNSASISICPSLDGSGVVASISPQSSGIALQSSVRLGSKTDIAIGEIGEASLKISGTILRDEGCVVRYRSVPDPLAYFARVYGTMLRDEGLGNPKSSQSGTEPPSSQLLYRHLSEPLSWIVHGMNHFSTNMIAESLVYGLGCSDDVCSRERGLEAMRMTLRQSHPGAEFHLEDGSGLSHANRVSAKTLLQVLLTALRDPRIAPEYESSLSIGGVSGTLKKRDINGDLVLVRGKTGSLDGVSSLAGIVYTKSGNRVAYVALENNISDKEKATKWEERVVNALYQSY